MVASIPEEALKEFKMSITPDQIDFIKVIADDCPGQPDTDWDNMIVGIVRNFFTSMGDLSQNSREYRNLIKKHHKVFNFIWSTKNATLHTNMNSDQAKKKIKEGE